MDPVRLSVFHELFAALAEEMGEVLRCTAPSVNIRERCDFSCALFDTNGALISQAAHIPVHLGSAALSVAAVRDRFPELEPGDAVLLNDPYAGGTHLPDLTLVSPVFPEDGAGSQGPWYLVNRAHHSDVGGSRPGSMAPASDLPAEGLRIPPVKLLRRGEWVRDVLELVLANTRTPALREGDLRSQVEANRLGARRVRELWERYGRGLCQEASEALFAYSARLISVHLAKLERGSYRARELLEGDGVVEHELPLVLELRVRGRGKLDFDFSESADQAPGSMNANPAVVLAAVLYAISCLVPEDVPANAGLLAGVRVRTRPGSILDPVFPAAVAGGNVETSQRLVDLCFAALGEAGAPVPAQSSGTMNNLSLGGRAPAGESFAFYETIAGGAGAGSEHPGASAVQTHMTNTRNTPVEELELSMPLVVERYTIRRRSGGRGARAGGDGIVKELRPLVPMQVSLLAERRRIAPSGLDGGEDAEGGGQYVMRGGRKVRVEAKGSFVLDAGERLCILTPGGGGHGRP